jgi:diaminopimelate decarboxylase
LFRSTLRTPFYCYSSALIAAAYERAAKLPGVEVCGIDIHIGSQLMSLDPFEAAFKRIAGLATDLRADGHNISTLDLGGGLGIAYDQIVEAVPTAEEYAQLAIETF